MGARPPFSKEMVLKYGLDAEDVVNRIQKKSCGNVLKRPPHGKVVKQAAGLKTSRGPTAKVASLVNSAAKPGANAKAVR